MNASCRAAELLPVAPDVAALQPSHVRSLPHLPLAADDVACHLPGVHLPHLEHVGESTIELYFYFLNLCLACFSVY